MHVKIPAKLRKLKNSGRSHSDRNPKDNISMLWGKAEKAKVGRRPTEADATSVEVKGTSHVVARRRPERTAKRQAQWSAMDATGKATRRTNILQRTRR